MSAVDVGAGDFESAVADALDALPPDVVALLDDVVVLVEEEPPPGAGELLGLYEGVPLTERDGGWAAGALPDRITLYRGPALRAARTREEVVREVAVTVAHELGHHLGLSEERLHELGWG